jgi:hypothetical protein
MKPWLKQGLLVCVQEAFQLLISLCRDEYTYKVLMLKTHLLAVTGELPTELLKSRIEAA